MVMSAYYAAATGAVSFSPDNKGTVLSSPGLWIGPAMTSMWVNQAIIAGIMALMIFINKAYNIPRTITLIYATFFAILQTATSRRRVFLVFFMLSSAVSVQYAFIIYIPVFLIACAQMRIFTLRTVLASLLGLITPWWILIGGGIVAPSDFHLPELTGISEITGSEN